MSSAPSFVKAHKPQLDEDKLTQLKTMARQARSLELEIENLEERTKEKKAALLQLTTKELPDLMNDNGIPAISIEAEGNEPAYDLKLAPFYSANIAADWPPEKRAAAFKWLDDNGHGDLIKTIVSVPFARDDRKKAKALAEKLGKDYGVTLQEAVHFMTLTAFLKEMTEKGNMPPLETIGGIVGRIVKNKRALNV